MRGYVQFNKYTHTHTRTKGGHADARLRRRQPTRMEGTQEGQIPYLSSDVPVDRVGFMPVSSTAARGPGTVGTGAQRETAQVEPLGAQPSQEGTQPHSPSQTHIQLIFLLFPREKTYQGTAANVTAHHRKVHPEEGTSLLDKLGKPLQKTPLESIWCLLQMRRPSYKPQQALEWMRSNIPCDHTPVFWWTRWRALCEKTSHALDLCSGKFQPKPTVFT